MGSEKINDVKQPPAKMSKKHSSESPFSGTSSSTTTLTPSASQIIKKKKDKKQKQKSKEKERDETPLPPPSSSSSSMFVETTNTAQNYGSEVYYCPGCGLADDGSPMIGCDTCDGWYHWPCVGIKEEPAEDVQWFCPKCQAGSKKKKKKKKREL